MLGNAAFPNLSKLTRESEPAGLGKRMIHAGFSRTQKAREEGNLKCQPGLLAGVTSVMDLNAFRKETFAALTAAAVENGAAVFGFHACAETELMFTGAFGRLIGWFHDLGAVKK
jgi:hypothetical protein